MWDKAYYITIKDASKRQKFIESQFTEQGLLVEKIIGIDKKNITQDYLDLNKYIMPNCLINRCWKTPGVIGCWLSHCLLWKDILNKYSNSDEKVFLIFEDDAKLCCNFIKQYDFYMKYVPNDWDMVWLGHTKLKGTYINRYVLKPTNNPGYGYNSQTHCYIIKKSSIEKLLNIVWPIKPHEAIDTLLRKHFDKFNAYFIRNNIATQNKQFKSTILHSKFCR